MCAFSTLLWIDLLESHGQAVETASKLAAQLKTSDVSATTAGGGSGGYSNGYTNGYHIGGDDEDLSGVFSIDTSVDKEMQQNEAMVAMLQESMQNVSNLLSSVEEIIRERLLGNTTEERANAAAVAASGKEAMTAALGPSSSNTRSSKQQQPTQNSLDAYLNGTAIEEDPAFVNSVRGWNTSSAPLQVKASMPEVILLDGLELHDVMMQNNVRHFAASMHAAHPTSQVYSGSSYSRAHALPASAQSTHHSPASKVPHAKPIDASEKKAKKRKLASVTASTVHRADTLEQYAEAQNQISHRNVRKQIANLNAEKVLMHRDGNHLCSYLVKYAGREEPIWVLRKQCAPQAQQKIDDFNKRRLATTRKVNRQRAEDAAERLQSGDAAATDSDVDEGDIYIVDKIVGHRMRYGKKQYLVKWDGYDSSDNTWEAASKLQDDVADVVEAYERKVALAEKQGEQAPTELPGGQSISNNGTADTSGHRKSKHQRHAADIENKQRRRKHRAVMVKSALGIADDEESDADVEILSRSEGDNDSDGHSTIDLENEIVIVDSDDSGLSD